MKIMKPTSLSLFRPALAMLAVTITCELSISPAQAGYIVTLQEVGSNVVATGSGSIDLTDLVKLNVVFVNNDITPNTGLMRTGPFVSVNADTYALVTGPTSFGSGSGAQGNTGSGDMVGISGTLGKLYVPQGYLSGILTDSMTVNNATFASLGVTPGTYVWTWGTDVHADSFTLQLGPEAGVPDTGSTLRLLFVSLIALFGINRFRACRLA